MRDHVQALIEGTREDSRFRAFAKLARQRITIAIKRLMGGRIWQDGFYERTLRHEESTLDEVPDLLEAVSWRPGGCRN